MVRGRLRRPRGADPASAGEPAVLEIDPGDLAGAFAAPGWLRDLGVLSWLLVGVAAALVGAVWLLALTQSIVVPLIVGAIIASVASPLVGWLRNRGLPRAVGAALTLLLISALGAGVVVLVLAGVGDQADAIVRQLEDAAESLAGALRDAGIGAAEADEAKLKLGDSLSDGFRALIGGVAAGIGALASLAVFLTFTILITFFLLKDGPQLRAFVASHMGVPRAVGETVITRTAGSLQSYFLGMTLVSVFSATIVGLGALALGVDLAGTIAVVTFLGGYVPYLGAWLAGAFAVAMALGSNGPEAALALAVIVLLANGALQQLVQPIAYGATLGLHPLAVLVVTIAGGALFGAIGLILAAPLLSAAVKVAADLERARSSGEAGEQRGGVPAPASG